MAYNFPMRQKTPRISFRKWIESHHPSAFLLAAQFILLILYAVFDGLHSQRAVLSAFGGLILMLIVWVVDRSPAVNWVAWVLAIPAFVLSILSAFFDAPFWWPGRQFWKPCFTFTQQVA